MSGDALNSSQLMLSLETAMEDCVRAFAFMVPLRRPSQFGQLQFHWGNPPPAPEPSTLIRMIYPCYVAKRSEKNESPCTGPSLSTLPLLAIGDVHGDFKTETHIGVLRLGPHVSYLLVGLKYYIGEDNEICSAVLAMASPSRYASERIRSQTSPAQVRLQLWTLVARLTAEKSANFSHDFHEIASESLLDSMGCIIFEHGSGDA